jgi:PIN domain nuclease of toxin-antitoxin system
VRLLLDTHTIFWWMTGDPKLSASASALVQDKANSIYVSIGSAWEFAIKVGLGKWPEAETLIAGFENDIRDEGFIVLPITVPHVRSAGLMVAAHRDPFDRLLAAQAFAEGLTLVTTDAKLASLGAPVIW